MPCPIGPGASRTMRNLFLKIFLWFWVTFVIVAVTLVAVTVSIRSDDEAKAKISIYLPFEARLAVEIYEPEDQAGLKHNLDRFKDAGFAEPYLLVGDGQAVFGRKPAPRAAESARATEL